MPFHKINSTNRDEAKKHTYYFSVNGNDNNDGSMYHPFKTIEHFNSLKLNPGDSIFFKGKEIFNGNLTLDSTKSGVNEKPVVITSYGKENAIIITGNGMALSIYNLSYPKINNLNCKGSGRKKGNTKPGIEIIDLQYLFRINTGTKDFNCETINKKYLGACTHQ